MIVLGCVVIPRRCDGRNSLYQAYRKGGRLVKGDNPVQLVLVHTGHSVGDVMRHYMGRVITVICSVQEPAMIKLLTSWPGWQTHLVVTNAPRLNDRDLMVSRMGAIINPALLVAARQQASSENIPNPVVILLVDEEDAREVFPLVMDHDVDMGEVMARPHELAVTFGEFDAPEYGIPQPV